MAINPEAVRARDSADYSTEVIRKRQANRPAESFVGYWDDQLIADVTALLANDLKLNSIIGDYIRSAQGQAERIDALLAEVERLRGVISEQQHRNLQLSYKAYPPNHSGE